MKKRCKLIVLAWFQTSQEILWNIAVFEQMACMQNLHSLSLTNRYRDESSSETDKTIYKYQKQIFLSKPMDVGYQHEHIVRNYINAKNMVVLSKLRILQQSPTTTVMNTAITSWDTHLCPPVWPEQRHQDQKKLQSSSVITNKRNNEIHVWWQSDIIRLESFLVQLAGSTYKPIFLLGASCILIWENAWQLCRWANKQWYEQVLSDCLPGATQILRSRRCCQIPGQGHTCRPQWSLGSQSTWEWICERYRRPAAPPKSKTHQKRLICLKVSYNLGCTNLHWEGLV